MDTTWRQDFYTQLAAKARAERCFIYNPDKEIVAGTIRLEIGETSLTHTGWGVNESRAWLEFYSANPARAAYDIPESNRRFEKLLEHKAAIEKAFGAQLDWDFDAGRKHQKVVTHAKVKATETNRKAWPMIQADLIDRATRLNAALKPYLAALDDPYTMKRLDSRQAASKSDVSARSKPIVSSASKLSSKIVSSPRSDTIEQSIFNHDELKI